MKKLRLLSLVGITSIALAQSGLAAPHGGGGGGFGGGFHSGGGFTGGGFRSAGVGGASHFGGFQAPGPRVGVGTRGGGVGFGMGRYSPYMSAPTSSVRSSLAGRSAGSNVAQEQNTRGGRH